MTLSNYLDSIKDKPITEDTLRDCWVRAREELIAENEELADRLKVWEQYTVTLKDIVERCLNILELK